MSRSYGTRENIMKPMHGGGLYSAVAVPVNSLVASTGLIPNLRPSFTGESHFLSNYLGSNTNIAERERRGDKPVTCADACARTHDYDYKSIGDDYRSKKISRPDAVKRVRKSDTSLRQCARDSLSKDKSTLNTIHATLADRGMQLKNLGEDVGLIDELKYVGDGKGKSKDPARKLKAKAKKLIGQGEMIIAKPIKDVIRLPKPPKVDIVMSTDTPIRPRLPKPNPKTVGIGARKKLKHVLEELPHDVLRQMIELQKSGEGLKPNEIKRLLN